MAAAGRSMTPFYVALGAIAVVGGALIVTRMQGRSAPPLTTTVLGPIAAGPRGVVEGSADAPVEVAEYSDFECPWCARFSVLQLPDIRARLIAAGRVRWRFLHSPLPQHTRAPEAHLAAACANRQGRFWPMHDLIYQNQDDWVASRRPAQVIRGYAERVGLDMSAFRQCVDRRDAWGDVVADKALSDSMGVSGTPTFYVNGRLFDEVPGLTFDRLRQIVDSLAPAAPAPPPGAPRR